MVMSEFSTEGVAADRFALWEDIAARTHMRNLLRSEDQHDFRARMRVLDLGRLQVSAPAFPHLDVVRTARLIRQGDPEVQGSPPPRRPERESTSRLSDEARTIPSTLPTSTPSPSQAHRPTTAARTSPKPGGAATPEPAPTSAPTRTSPRLIIDLNRTPQR